MAKILKIHHVAVAVADMELSLSFWRDTLGLQVTHVEEVPSQKSVVAFLPCGEGEIELVKPSEIDSNVAKFLAEKGGGMHHLCFEVDDIEAMLEQIKRKGARLINEVPLDLPGRKVAFIHPRSSGGVLVELFQKTG